ncbi:DUF4199 domain-containing protein [Bernardetia sp.]|uniref:DUF4199 domain-containing protein n=1 Tax=Bernardetia sp. TaxID=1937974 RepID=UPI0025B8FD25|nr:DUF4199 domain-containing protein [Bernardetia sp.]
MQLSIRYGIILGVLNCLLALFGYLMGAEFSLSYYSIISFILSIGSIVLVSYLLKKNTQGVIKYFDAVKLVFVALMVSFAIGSTYNLVFNNFIAPEYNEEIGRVTLEKTQSMMESMGMPEDAVDEAIEEARKGLKEAKENPYLPFLQGLMTGAVVLFVISLLAAIFVQRKPKDGEFLYDDDIIDDSSSKETW